MLRNTITRRRILDGVGLVGVASVLGSSLALAGTRWEGEGGPARGAGSERPWHELGIIGEPISDNLLLCYLSRKGQAMADVGGCFDIAGRIDVGDENGWPREWLETAEDTGLVRCQTGAPSVASQRMFDWLSEHI
jgi:hypothetical protein